MEKVEEHGKKGQCKNKTESLKAKKLQSEIPLKYDEEDYGWLNAIQIPEKQRQCLVYRNKWLKQEHGRN